MEPSGWNQEEWERQNKRRGRWTSRLAFIGVFLLLSITAASIFGLLDLPFSGEKDRTQQYTYEQRIPEDPGAPERQPAADRPSGSRPPVIRDIPEDYSANIMTSGIVRSIVEQCGDAVVRIATEATRAPAGNPFFDDPFFRDFFGPQQPRKETSMGSGFLFRQDGYILTNNHVVDGAESISVYLTSSETPFEATVIGTAPELDLAVIRIEGDSFPFLVIGDSDEVYVGDWVVAIGNPYGLDHTVTVGVISAMGRPLTIEGTMYQDLLQTDAAINPGNSGGPMLNLDGEVIGINTAVSAIAQGIGFAIPSRTVLNVLDDLEAGVERTVPWMGINMQPMSRDMLQYFNIENMDGGVIVYSVFKDSPADKAGIRRGDVILEVGEQKISETAQVQGIILRHKVGDIVKIKIHRDGDEVEYMVELEERQIQ